MSEEFFTGDVLKESRYLKKFEKLREENLLPLTGTFALVEKLKPEERKTRSNIVIATNVETHTGTMASHQVPLGIVLAIGPGKVLEDGTLIPPAHKVGQVVILPYSVDWFSNFFGWVDYEPYTIGKIIDEYISCGTNNYVRIREIGNEDV